MQLHLSSASVRIFNVTDLFKIENPKCLINESFAFQVFVDSPLKGEYPIKVESNFNVSVYEVINKKGNYFLKNKRDDFYVKSEDETYPELLLPTTTLKCNGNENKTLFFDILDLTKNVGENKITVFVGDNKVEFTLNVINAQLPETDIKITHWFHLDAICNYYNVEPFSPEFYKHFENFLKAYTRMGNNMLLIPMFTPPLDTEVGGERLTTQLVKVEKVNDSYVFDFSEMKKYIDVAKSYGIKYFELSHLYTQWGGEFCPKIIAKVNGENKRIFGWDVSSTDASYKNFLIAFLKELNNFLIKEKIKENSFMHLTDEPIGTQADKYAELSKFIKENNFDIQTMDAMSHYEIVEKSKIDLPVLCLETLDYDLFKNQRKMHYYCEGIDNKGITNRYFHMPLLRTMILGVQLFREKTEGFLHWGFNFYNTRWSKAVLNPYEDATAGGHFNAGDTFIVYPAENGVNYSIRYFALLKAFEDYRLLKAIEYKFGVETADNLLKEFGVISLFDYPRDLKTYQALKDKCYELLQK